MESTSLKLFTIFNMRTGKPYKVIARTVEAAKDFAIEKLGILSQYVCVSVENVYLTYAKKNTFDDRAYYRILDMTTSLSSKGNDAFVAF